MFFAKNLELILTFKKQLILSQIIKGKKKYSTVSASVRYSETPQVGHCFRERNVSIELKLYPRSVSRTLKNNPKLDSSPLL